MKKFAKYIYNLITVFVFLIFPINTKASEFTFVDTSKQLYTYDEMVEDIINLAVGHEDRISYESRAVTSQGRNIWLIKFGNLQSENKILITASIHSREYMTSQLVMKMLEEYVLNYDVPNASGTTYRQYFANTCFYILPMINPDGVSISQFGAAGATQELTINWLNGCKAMGYDLTQIKANANGVDLNRNFPIGFGCDKKTASVPGLSNYPGAAPLSEAETQVMAILLNENTFSSAINYHSMGNLIYYGASTNTPDVANRCKNMATIVHAVNKYKMVYCGDAIGSFADYFGAVESAPSITIEIGTANPVPIKQFSNIYNKNINVWPIIANSTL
ncbi:MAG: M14 family metallocarboxypeptidase [Pseudobutyrivibrio sp.]|nr:M14 family metallocarboxypeptidase [Pseudobutyrivibrio sp.]